MEKFIKQFIWGISVLTAYLHYNNKINYSDINILSEGFIRDLLNILFDLKLSNSKKQNSPGYNLISTRDKMIIQVSTACTPKKVKDTFLTLNRLIPQVVYKKKELEMLFADMSGVLSDIDGTIDRHKIRLDAIQGNKSDSEKEEELLQEETRRLIEKKTNAQSRLFHIGEQITDLEDIRDYKVQFFFLCENVDAVVNYKKKCGFADSVPESLHFSQTDDMLCFTSLIHKVQNLSPLNDIAKIEQLKRLMAQNPNIFNIRDDNSPCENRVNPPLQTGPCAPVFKP